MNPIFIHELLKILMVLLLVSLAVIISQRNLISLIHTYALHSFVLSFIAYLFFLETGVEVFLYTALLTIVSKSLFIPWLLKRAQKNMNIYTDMEYHYLGPTSSIFLSLLIILIGSFVFYHVKEYLGLNPFSYFGVYIGFSLVMMGFMIIFSRKKIITKIIGYLVMENGVVLLSLFIGEMPLLIEVLVLMDLLVLVAISSILAFGMNSSMEEFHKKLNPFHRWSRRGVQK